MMTTSSRNASTIGPQLPPGFKRAEVDDTDDDGNSSSPIFPASVSRNTESENNGEIVGPMLSAGMSRSDETDDNFGCMLPPAIKPVTANESVDILGPALPPHMRKEYIGPSLPPQLKHKSKPALSSRTVIGPVFPGTNFSDSEEDEDDDDNIGPRLSEAADVETQSKCTASADFERRAEKMKNMILSKDSDVKVREEWMTELPSRMVPQLGLGARTFKKRAGVDKDDDRSEWTDTPADKKRKAEIGDVPVQGPSVADVALHRRNQEISKNLHQYNKSKRSESLMDIHQKKRKDKKKEKKEERREFDRDKDLNIQNVDAAQAKSFMDKAKLFGGKFSHGASHFL